MAQEVKYEVQLERKKRDAWFEHKYWWEVNVYSIVNETDRWGEKITEKQIYDLRNYGYAKSIKAAKKKAVKHILKVQTEVDSGVTFGMVFKVNMGTADEVIKELTRE